MGTEYIRLSNTEKIYGNRNMLYVQLEFLNSMRSFRNYRELRSREFILKVSLKNRIGEALALLAKVDSILPKTTFRIAGSEEQQKKKKISHTFQDEVSVIELKLAKLQREM